MPVNGHFASSFLGALLVFGRDPDWCGPALALFLFLFLWGTCTLWEDKWRKWFTMTRSTAVDVLKFNAKIVRHGLFTQKSAAYRCIAFYDTRGCHCDDFFFFFLHLVGIVVVTWVWQGENPWWSILANTNAVLRSVGFG